MEKRYQVFVSSTFQDLQEERQEIMQALLELDCIPAGMELFPATNEDQWTLIKKVIDDCDYYILIMANRYGSIGPDGISYTEMEYRYALDRNKPIIGFLHEAPSSISVERSDKSQDAIVKLEAFRDLVKKKTVRMWSSPKDLGSKVSRSMIQLVKTNPAIGWVRADAAAKDLSAPEILRLRTIIDNLNQKLEEQKQNVPDESIDLAQGNDIFDFSVDVSLRTQLMERGSIIFRGHMSWNEIFNTVGPHLIDEASERAMNNALNDYIKEYIVEEEDFRKRTDGQMIYSVTISSNDFQTIKVQLMALSLIEKSKKNRSIKNTGAYWCLTPHGESALNKLRAIRRAPL